MSALGGFADPRLAAVFASLDALRLSDHGSKGGERRIAVDDESHRDRENHLPFGRAVRRLRDGLQLLLKLLKGGKRSCTLAQHNFAGVSHEGSSRVDASAVAPADALGSTLEAAPGTYPASRGVSGAPSGGAA